MHGRMALHAFGGTVQNDGVVPCLIKHRTQTMSVGSAG